MIINGTDNDLEQSTENYQRQGIPWQVYIWCSLYSSLPLDLCVSYVVLNLNTWLGQVQNKGNDDYPTLGRRWRDSVHTEEL